MIIDIFAHVFPTAVMDRLEALSPNFPAVKAMIPPLKQLHDFDDRFRLMDEAGEFVQIISLVGPPIEVLASPEHGPEIARVGNDAMAELVDRHPDRFPGFVAALSLHDVESALAELHRAIRDLKARGVQVYTDVAGRPLDDPAYDPVFAAMADYGLPVWMHPARGPDVADYGAESESLYNIWLILGWPYMTAVTMMRLVLSGLYDRHPGLKIITHHMGGMVPFHSERVARSLYRTSRELAKKEGAVRYSRPPTEMMRNFYADTAMHGAHAAVRCGIDYFGGSNVVFATDAPFGTPREHLAMIDRLELDERTRDAILRGNAERLMTGAGRRN